ncbi:MAG TPA: Calx-beta domain-containing protein [Micromonosporaceae bacterium]|nr:Calx-beta domain-containing protein [Micromonosporaceae bacterium]
MSSRMSVSRWLALAAAIMFVLPGTGGCTGAQPPKCGGDDPCYHVDDFVCISGGCQAVFTRDCMVCGPIQVDWSTEDITAKAGVDYVGVPSGRAEFPADVKTATVTIETLEQREATQSKTFRVILSVNGAVVGSGVGTIPPAT